MNTGKTSINIEFWQSGGYPRNKVDFVKKTSHQNGLKNQHYYYVIPPIVSWQLYLKGSLKNFKSIGPAVSEKFCSLTLKTEFREKRVQSFGRRLHKV